MSDLAALVRAAETEAAVWDRTGLPRAMVAEAAAAGLFGVGRPERFGGDGAGAHRVGRIAEQLGAVCTSLRSLYTVQGLVAAAVDRWGTAEQRQRWLPGFTSGAVLAGLAATEAGAGSDLSAVRTSFTDDDGCYRLSGRKLWVTFGELADVVLVVGRAPAGTLAAVVPTAQPGVTVEPVTDELGMRGARLAHITFDAVTVPAGDVLARPGFGLSHVIGTALDHGRFTIAWGCLGMARACLADAAAHARTRAQADTRLADHQMVRAALGRSWVQVQGAQALCARAADHRADRNPDALTVTIAAKYAAAEAAAAVSERAVQLLGAAGCAPDSRVGRFFRDAKVMQIIEGAREVAEQDIGAWVLRGDGQEHR
ncbi:acyl-CoA dehydrogenase family protein [Nocardia cyriacigeorgica]|uniref:acyl-CoA dehydrogenase family protein n=1 Tax=Nocardia cyriacigeorgica TaxID=135487 RepID=UPI002459095E|nr:acyl-CoA dehydrogenase family protein [Nocardia cyriacigeorgica]